MTFLRAIVLTSFLSLSAWHLSVNAFGKSRESTIISLPYRLSTTVHAHVGISTQGGPYAMTAF